MEQHQVGRGLFNSLDVISTHHLLRTQQNEYQVWMKRVYFSHECRYYYITLIILTAVCIVWSIINFGHFPKDSWFQALEILLCLMMLAETIWRGFMEGWKQLLEEWENEFEIIVAIGSICILGISLLLTGHLEAADGLVGLCGIALRNVMMYMRLIIYLKDNDKNAVTIIDLQELSQVSEVRELSEDIEIKQISPYIHTEMNLTKSGITYKYLEQGNPEENEEISVIE